MFCNWVLRWRKIKQLSENFFFSCVTEWREYLWDDKLPWSSGENAGNCGASRQKQPEERKWALLLPPGLQHLRVAGQHCQWTDRVCPGIWGEVLFWYWIMRTCFGAPHCFFFFFFIYFGFIETNFCQENSFKLACPFFFLIPHPHFLTPPLCSYSLPPSQQLTQDAALIQSIPFPLNCLIAQPSTRS